MFLELNYLDNGASNKTVYHKCLVRDKNLNGIKQHVVKS